MMMTTTTTGAPPSGIECAGWAASVLMAAAFYSMSDLTLTKFAIVLSFFVLVAPDLLWYGAYGGKGTFAQYRRMLLEYLAVLSVGLVVILYAMTSSPRHLFQRGGKRPGTRHHDGGWSWPFKKKPAAANSGNGAESSNAATTNESESSPNTVAINGNSGDGAKPEGDEPASSPTKNGNNDIPNEASAEANAPNGNNGAEPKKKGWSFSFNFLKKRPNDSQSVTESGPSPPESDNKKQSFGSIFRKRTEEEKKQELFNKWTDGLAGQRKKFRRRFQDAPSEEVKTLIKTEYAIRYNSEHETLKHKLFPDSVTQFSTDQQQLLDCLISLEGPDNCSATAEAPTAAASPAEKDQQQESAKANASPDVPPSGNNRSSNAIAPVQNTGVSPSDTSAAAPASAAAPPSAAVKPAVVNASEPLIMMPKITTNIMITFVIGLILFMLLIMSMALVRESVENFQDHRRSQPDFRPESLHHSVIFLFVSLIAFTFDAWFSSTR